MLTALSISTGGLGRFGNTAFTIASVIGIACKSGQPYGFPAWLTKDNAIFGDPVDVIDDYLLNPLPRIPLPNQFQNFPYFWGYRDIKLPTGNWSIDCHLQSDKYFRDFMPLIRHHFTFKDELEQNEYVAIHYRAGDYIDDPTAHHPRCTKQYYEKALEHFPAGSKCYVFSDDPYAALQTIGRKDFLYPAGDYIEHFKLMKRCRSFICANSSYSLMAAILGEHPEKKIICPSVWFGTGMPPEFDPKDIYPENAIII